MVSPKWLFIIGCLVLVVTGCATSPEPENNIVVPTSVPALIDSITATVTATPFVETASPTPDSRLTPTPEAIVTATSPSNLPENGGVGEVLPYVIRQLPSPDGQWIVTTAYTRLQGDFPLEVDFTLTDLRTEEPILIESRAVAEGDPFVEWVPFPLAWRADSQAFYYTDIPGYIDGCWVGTQKSPLHQYTLATNTYETLAMPAGSWHHFSPDTQHVAYFPIRPADALPALAIYTPATATLDEIPLPEFDPSLAFTQDLVAQILWSPDGEIMMLSVLASPCSDSVPALLLVNRGTLEMTLIEAGTTYYRLEGWDGTMVIISDGDGIERRYDIATGEWVGEQAIP